MEWGLLLNPFGRKTKSQQARKLKDNIVKQISKSDAPIGLTDNLAFGMFGIMRNLPGYRVEHFFKDNFYASQFFQLLSLINYEVSKSDKEYRAMERKNRKGR